MASESFDLIDVARMLREACQKAGGQAAWGAPHGIPRQVVHNVMSGHRRPTERVLRALGLREVTRYVPIKPSARQPQHPVDRRTELEDIT